MATLYPRIVVGGGIIGSFTAYQLAKAGHKTLLLEQFPVPHQNGSSHGGSRITRKTYKHDFFANMMNEAFETWSEVESLSQERLYKQTGIAVFDSPPYKLINDMKGAMDKYSMPYDMLNYEEVSKTYPQLELPEDYIALLDPSGGILSADKAVAAVQKLFQKNGGILMDNCTVTEIEPGNVVTVKTTKGDFQAESLIICSGTWSKKLLKGLDLELPLESQKITVYYWEEKEHGMMTAEKGFPCFILSTPSEEFYCIPSWEYPELVKLVRHSGVPFECDSYSTATDDDPDKQTLVNVIEKHVTGLKPSPSKVELCKYTVTPDEVCLLDYHPRYKNVIIGTGFSGTGFKIAPTVGRILKDLSNHKDPGCNMEPFKISRFC